MSTSSSITDPFKHSLLIFLVPVFALLLRANITFKADWALIRYLLTLPLSGAATLVSSDLQVTLCRILFYYFSLLPTSFCKNAAGDS